MYSGGRGWWAEIKFSLTGAGLSTSRGAKDQYQSLVAHSPVFGLLGDILNSTKQQLSLTK